MTCQCFMCTHKGDEKSINGYLNGYIDACNWFINWAEKNKLKIGRVDGDKLEDLYAQMLCNRDESLCLLNEEIK